MNAKVYNVPRNDLRVNNKVQDDLKLAYGIGEVPKTEWSGWRFNSQPWNLLSTWREN